MYIFFKRNGVEGPVSGCKHRQMLEKTRRNELVGVAGISDDSHLHASGRGNVGEMKNCLDVEVSKKTETGRIPSFL